jgi:hypothetical protein
MFSTSHKNKKKQTRMKHIIKKHVLERMRRNGKNGE